MARWNPKLLAESVDMVDAVFLDIDRNGPRQGIGGMSIPLAGLGLLSSDRSKSPCHFLTFLAVVGLDGVDDGFRGFLLLELCI